MEVERVMERDEGWAVAKSASDEWLVVDAVSGEVVYHVRVDVAGHQYWSDCEEREPAFSDCLEGYGGLLLPVPYDDPNDDLDNFRSLIDCPRWWADSAAEAMDRVDAWIAGEQDRPELAEGEGEP